MEVSPDEVLEELRSIATRLEDLPPESPDRTDLLQRRDELRMIAQQAADAARNPANLRSELEHLRSRLEDLESDKVVVPSWQVTMTRGGRLSLIDPVADAARINDAIDEGSAPDRAAIEARISHLEEVLGE